MTLVFSLLTSKYVIQVSDRRITDKQTKALMDEEENKAVVFCGKVAFAYAGKAEIDSKATEIWLAEHLKECNSPATAFETIVKKANISFKRIPGEWRHIFTAAGWGRRELVEPLAPFVVKIRNYDDGTVTDFGRLEFEWIPPGRQLHLTSVGQQVSDKRMVEMELLLGKAVDRDVSAIALAEFLVRSIREISISKATVGPNVMVVIIPRAAAERGSSDLVVPMTIEAAISSSSDQVTCFRVGIMDDRWAIEGPTLVCSGSITTASVVQAGPGARRATRDEMERMRRRLGQPPGWLN